MGPASWMLGGVQALWLVALVVVGLRRAVRPRVLVTSGLGLLTSLVVTTTATPTEQGVPLGLLLGTGVAIALTLATRRGVTFTWMPDTRALARRKTTTNCREPAPCNDSAQFLRCGSSIRNQLS